LDWLKRDVGTGLRLLRRDKAFTLTAALTLAFCIGANTALFSVVRHVLLRPLPVAEPDRILLMSNSYPKAGAGDLSNSGVPDYYDRLRETTVFEQQALFNRNSVSLGQDGTPTRVQVMNVTPSFFPLLRVAPTLGRPFTEEEGEPGNEKKVVLSDALWHRQFGGDPGVVGHDVRLDGQPYTIVGVMPATFQAVAPDVALWRPLAFTAEQKSDAHRHSNNWWNIGRLKPGATLEQAQAQVDALNAANFERFPQYKEVLLNAGFCTIVDRYADHLVRAVKPTLYLLWGGALFVLLIGCVNVANLVLVRARARLKELATRLALGASPVQIARQLVIENVLLTLAAAIAGLLVGAAALRSLSGFDLQDLPYGSDIRLDGPATLYALGVSLVIGFAMGLLPVVTALPSGLASVLKAEGRSSSGGRDARILRHALVVAQVAFTFVLLVGAGVLFASFQKVLEVDPGFVPEHVTTASVVLPASRYSDDAFRTFTDDALRRIRALPGVTHAGATNTIPFGSNHSDSVILAEGYEMKPGESILSPNAVDVTPGYFEALGARLVKGRFFTDADKDKAPPVMIVDEKLAARFWPNQDPIGRRLYFPTDINNLVAVNEKTVFITVVAVVRDLKLRDLTEGSKTVGTYYYPMAQDSSQFLTFAVKSAGGDESIPAGLRGVITSLDRELPLFDVQTLGQRTDKSLFNRRAPAMISLSFGVLALLLSAVGIYGVLAYLVTQRTREIGIRVALGSTGRAIFDLVIREGLWLVGAGFVVGGLGMFALRDVLESQLFEVRAGDPRVALGVTLVLALVAFAACALPARRAARIDPKVALSD
jgi:predicted permease